MSEKYIIEINNLVKKYRRSAGNAVDGLNVKIRQDDIFGLIGPNGAGKTTTLNILTGKIQASSGEISIGGYDLKKDLNLIKHIIGVVPQDIALYPSLMAMENLYIFGTIIGLKGNILKNRINELLELFAIDDPGKKRLSEFSGGMKRRINLIAGILNRPKILFLDEPTVGLDVQSNNLIIENLRMLNRQGTTIIYTSHYMEEAENFCNQIAIIDKGKIIANGSPGELINIYEGCYRLEDVYLHLTGYNLRD
jgi:ABC-2 type transport system ATP-binding protein